MEPPLQSPTTTVLKPNRTQADLDEARFEIRSAPEHVSEVEESEFLLSEKEGSYILLNKPPDVRMNGDFAITIESIILRWRPHLQPDCLKWVSSKR